MEKIPIWENCKTKEQKKKFMEHLEKLESTEKTISFDDWIFKEYMRELSN